MAMPTIGVVPLWDEKRDRIWMVPGYLERIERAGGLPVVLPLTDDRTVLPELAHRFDGFLFTGGQDVSPELYNRAASPLCGPPCRVRDSMEAALFQLAVLLLDKPAFGICRGMQLLNALLGGTLWQDLPAETDSQLVHKQEPPYSIPAHPVKIVPDSPLHALLGTGSLPVNSLHHQGIQTLAPELVPMARAHDGLVEAVRLPSRRFVWAVQWHPEYMPADAASHKLFSAFVQACVG